MLREDGTPLYELRNLHLSTALLACLKNEGYAYVLFRLGDAVLLIPLGKLEDANHIFTLEPILLGEETAVEQEAFANLVLLDDLHRVCVRVDGAIVELRKLRCCWARSGNCPQRRRKAPHCASSAKRPPMKRWTPGKR